MQPVPAEMGKRLLIGLTLCGNLCSLQYNSCQWFAHLRYVSLMGVLLGHLTDEKQTNKMVLAFVTSSSFLAEEESGGHRQTSFSSALSSAEGVCSCLSARPGPCEVRRHRLPRLPRCRHWPKAWQRAQGHWNPCSISHHTHAHTNTHTSPHTRTHAHASTHAYIQKTFKSMVGIDGTDNVYDMHSYKPTTGACTVWVPRCPQAPLL